jgi:hypothetical protein
MWMRMRMQMMFVIKIEKQEMGEGALTFMVEWFFGIRMIDSRRVGGVVPVKVKVKSVFNGEQGLGRRLLVLVAVKSLWTWAWGKSDEDKGL